MFIKLSEEDVNERLKPKLIKKIDIYIKNNVKIRFQCLKENCNHIWLAIPSNILTHNHGCPKCSKNAKLTDKEVDLKLKKINLIKLENYKGANTLLKVKCLICTYEWSAYPGNMFKKNKYCPNCNNTLKGTNEKIDSFLVKEEKQIKRLDDFINNRTKINFKCLRCFDIWAASPTNILRHRGCRKCNKTSKNEKLIINYFIKNNIIFNKQFNVKNIFNIIKNILVDFYFPNKNIIIEYNGAQHYRPVQFGGIDKDIAIKNFEKQKIRDNMLREQCKKNNINLIEIDGRIFVNNILIKFIEELIKERIK